MTNVFAVAEADDLEENLIAHYPLDGNANDNSGSGYNATNFGASPTVDRAGNAKNAYHFDGKNDYINVPVNINPEKVPELTITCWARVTNLPEDTMAVWSHNNGGFDRTLAIIDDEEQQTWAAFDGTGASGRSKVIPGQWAFLAVVYDQDKSKMTLYVNGEKKGYDTELDSGFDYLHIGSDPENGSYFNGDIDDVRIYNRALSTGEIERILGKSLFEARREAWERQKNTYIVNASTLNIRENPTTSSKVMGTVNQDERVVAIEKRKGWIKVNHNGTVGYLSRQYLKREKVKRTNPISEFLMENFSMRSFKTWIIIIILAIGLIFVYKNFRKIDELLNRIQHKEYLEPGNAWPMIAAFGAAIALLIASLWNSTETEWFLTGGGFSIIPRYQQPIHWYLYIVTLLCVGAAIGMLIESFKRVGVFMAPLRIIIMAILMAFTFFVVIYVSVMIIMIIIFIIALIFFLALLPAMFSSTDNRRRRYY